MKKEILTVCPICHRCKLVPREYKHPVSLVRISRECEQHWQDDSIELYFDKFNREIHPQTGKPI